MAVGLVRCVHQFLPGAPMGCPKEAPAVADGRDSYPGQTGALGVLRLGRHDHHGDLSASHPVAKNPDNWGNDDHQLGKARAELGGLQACLVTVLLEPARHDVSAQADHVSTQRDPDASGDQVVVHLGRQTVYGRHREVVYPANQLPWEDGLRDILGHGTIHLEAVW